VPCNTLDMFLPVLYRCWRFVVVTSQSYAKFMLPCAQSAHLFLSGRMAGQLCHHQIVLVYSLCLFTSSCFAPITSHVMSTKGHVTCQVACYITHIHLAAIVSCIRRAPYIQKKISIILEKLVEHTLGETKIPNFSLFLGWKINKICQEKQTLLGISSQWLNFAVKICVCEVSSISFKQNKIKWKIWSCRSCILSQFVGCYAQVYNGKNSVGLKITQRNGWS
jgi:hypothetical protein